jgi:hypothetical protein
MTRLLFALAALLLVCSAFATPAPEPFISGWDTPVDPDHDCKISRSGDSLTIEVPGTDHDYDPIRKCFNAPRLLRDIEGEFDIQVRVRIDCRPSVKSSVKGQPSFVSAGILLIYPDTFCTVCERFEFGLSQPGTGLNRDAVAKSLLLPRRENASQKGIGEDGYVASKTFWCTDRSSTGTWDHGSLVQSQMIYESGWLGWSLPKKTNSAYLRIEQGDKRIAFLISADGERWAYLNGGTNPPAKFKLGLAAYSTSSEPSKVRFDQLKLTRGKRNKR